MLTWVCMWRIDLLGGLRLQHDGKGVDAPASRKAALLLAYLAYYAGREHSREALIELLWPEGDFSAARNRLSVTLTSLRRLLEPPGVSPGAVLQSSRQSVRLAAVAVETDVAALAAALDSARLARERGDPLP